MSRPHRPRSSTLFLPVLFFACVALPSGALADEGEPPAHPASEGRAPVLPDHPNVHHQAKNSIHVFLGETWERVDGADITEKGFTFGIEYFRALSDRWAAGIVVERAAGSIRGTLLLAQAEFNIVGDLWFVTGPGVEFRDAYEEGHHGEVERHGEVSLLRAAHDVDQIMRESDRTVFVYRIGFGYAIHVTEDLLVIPTVDLDFVGRDEALVLGGILAYHF